MFWNKRKSKKELRHEETLAKIEEIKNLLINDEIKKLQENKIKLDSVLRDLKNVHLDVERITKGYDDNGNINVRISYKIDPVILTFTSGDLDYNQIFKSINMLDLISTKDMKKIMKFIDNVKKEIQ